MWYHYLAAVLAAAVPAAVFLCVRAAQKNREEVPVANVSVQGKEVSTTPHHVSLTFDKPQGETVPAVTESTPGTTETSFSGDLPLTTAAETGTPVIAPSSDYDAVAAPTETAVDEDGFTVVEQRGFGDQHRGNESDFFSSDEEEMEAKDISKVSVAIRSADESFAASEADVSKSMNRLSMLLSTSHGTPVNQNSASVRGRARSLKTESTHDSSDAFASPRPRASTTHDLGEDAFSAPFESSTPSGEPFVFGASEDPSPFEASFAAAPASEDTDPFASSQGPSSAGPAAWETDTPGATGDDVFSSAVGESSFGAATAAHDPFSAPAATSLDADPFSAEVVPASSTGDSDPFAAVASPPSALAEESADGTSQEVKVDSPKQPVPKPRPLSTLNSDTVTEPTPVLDVSTLSTLELPVVPPDAALLASVKAELRKEGVKLWLLPYSNEAGDSGIDDATVARFADACGAASDLDQVAAALEYLRRQTFNKKVARLQANAEE